jgi:hypothetical protein
LSYGIRATHHEDTLEILRASWADRESKRYNDAGQGKYKGQSRNPKNPADKNTENGIECPVQDVLVRLVDLRGVVDGRIQETHLLVYSVARFAPLQHGQIICAVRWKYFFQFLGLNPIKLAIVP